MNKGKIVDYFFVLSSIAFFVVLVYRTFDYENKVTFFIEVFFLVLVIGFGVAKIIISNKNKSKNKNDSSNNGEIQSSI